MEPKAKGAKEPSRGPPTVGPGAMKLILFGSGFRVCLSFSAFC